MASTRTVDSSDVLTPFRAGPRRPYKTIAYDEALRQHDIPPDDVIKRFGTWVVTEYGIECLATYYPIKKERLLENPNYSRLQHLSEKVWVNQRDFRAAHTYALWLFYGGGKGTSRPDHRGKGKNSLSHPGFSYSLRFAVLQRDGYRCQLCGASSLAGARLEVDHKTPRSKGGTTTQGNLWTLCFACNRGKSDRSL